MAHRRTPQDPADFSAASPPSSAESEDNQAEPVIGAFLGGPLGALIGEVLRATVKTALRATPIASPSTQPVDSAPSPQPIASADSKQPKGHHRKRTVGRTAKKKRPRRKNRGSGS